MTVDWLWAGGATDSSFVVKSKINTGTSTRLAVTSTGDFDDAVFFGPVLPTTENVVSFSATSLSSFTAYSYAIEIDGTLDEDDIGQITTHPPLGEPADFIIAAASCAGLNPDFPGSGGELAPNRISNHPVFQRIRNRNALEFIHMGDATYYDPGSGVHVPDASVSTYRTMFDDIHDQSNQAALYRSLGLRYMYDDHDYGPNDSDSTAPGRDNVIQVYQEVVPHGTLGSGGGSNPVYQAWQIARIQWVMWDLRADRSPNSDPPGPDKSMLGTAQRAWFENILATSTAEALVIVSTSVWWEPGRTDGWSSFQDEQAWIIDKIDEHGWTGKVVIVSGDVHALAIDTGGNSPGSIPVFQFASMDSSFGSVQHHYDFGPSRPGRDQFGTLRCRDLGDRIELTGTGWIGNEVWNSYTHTVVLEEPEPEPPEPGMPPVAQAEIRRRVTWLACDLVTGGIVYELPDLTGSVSRLITEVQSAGLTLPIPRSGPAALPMSIVDRVANPGRSMIVAVVNDIPLWAGIVMGPVESGTDATVTMPCVTLEGYLDRRYVRDHEWNGRDAVSVIAAGLVGDAGDIDGVGQGIGLVVDTPSSGIQMTREYKATDHRTVLSALQELSTVENGIEWTIDVDWVNANDRNRVQKIFRARPRLGTAVPTPQAIFQTTAHSVFQSQSSAEARYRFRDDYTAGRGATYVVAYSSGQGADQPTSAPAVATDLLDSGFPIYEQHYQPASDINSDSVLNSHAQAELERRANGVQTFNIEARWDAYPRYGVDWRLGDDVAWHLVGHRHPHGTMGQGRVLGFTLDMEQQIIVPILEEAA